jgi:hypothetical protein
MGNFQKDLETGARAQDFVIKQLEKEHKGIHQVPGYFKDYDLIADDGYTAEVKFDVLSRETHRTGFEYECYGKKSGVACTKAREWIHIYKLYNDWVYSKIPVGDLKAFLKSNWKELKTVPGGDNNASKMALVSVYDVADSFGYISIFST